MQDDVTKAQVDIYVAMHVELGNKIAKLYATLATLDPYIYSPKITQDLSWHIVDDEIRVSTKVYCWGEYDTYEASFPLKWLYDDSYTQEIAYRLEMRAQREAKEQAERSAKVEDTERKHLAALLKKYGPTGGKSDA